MFGRQERAPVGAVVETVAYWILLVTIVLLPFVAYTGVVVSSVGTKVAVSGILVLAACVAFAISRISLQELSFPRSILLGAAWLTPLAYLVATLLPAGGSRSVFGSTLSMDTFAFITVGALVLTLATLLATTQKRALGVYLALLTASLVLAVLETILFFARDTVVALGVALPSISLIGGLNDLGVFFGLITVFIVLSLVLLPVSSLMRAILGAALLVASLFLAVVNLTALWWVLGCFSLGTFVYSISVRYLNPDAVVRVSWASLYVLMLCVFFLAAKDSLTGAPARWLGVGEFDVRPSWQTTASLGRIGLGEHPVLGIGPSSFADLWSRHMPKEINTTAFWQADFLYGVGFIPTSIIATGLLGGVAWLVFLGVFLWLGVRQFVLSRQREDSNVVTYLQFTSFIGALFLWVTSVVEVPSPVLLLVAYLLTGIFIASRTFGQDVARVHLAFRDNPRIGFLVTLACTAGILVCIAGTYGFATRLFADITYERARVALSEGHDIARAEGLVLRAISLAPADAYYRLASTLTLLKVRDLVAQNKPQEELREPLQQLLSQAVDYARAAIVLDSASYQNWLNLGSVYQSIVPLGIDGSIDRSMEAFDKALEFRPDAPTIYLAKATLERARGNAEQARKDVEQAISLRNQYTDAIFLLAQMQLEANDAANAVRSVQAITLFEPQNPVAFFQLGLLEYGLGNFTGAAQSLEKAVALNTYYANARYFLGLAYWRLGNTNAAKEQFEAVRTTNPDNAEVRTIIENLSQGRAPFAVAAPKDDISGRSGVPVAGANEDDEKVPSGEGAAVTR